MAGLTGSVRFGERRCLSGFSMTAGTLTITDTIVMTVLTIIGKRNVRSVVELHRCLAYNLQANAVRRPQCNSWQRKAGNHAKNQSHNQ